jgi:hypothetical protein
MRQLFLSLVILTILGGCKKNDDEPATVLVDLGIIAATTPTTTTQGQDIVSAVRCSAPDLCYKFAKFEINETANRQFEIKAKATYPNSKKGDIVCAQAIYYADTSLKINAAAKGQYVLKFYNNNVLFKADTVKVN